MTHATIGLKDYSKYTEGVSVFNGSLYGYRQSIVEHVHATGKHLWVGMESQDCGYNVTLQPQFQ